MPTTAVKSTCQGTKKNGDPCGSPAAGDDGYCFWHSPNISHAQRHAAAAKGGLMCRPKVLPPTAADVRLSSPEACLELLQESVGQMRRGDIDIKVMNSIAYSVTAACRVWEVALSAKLNKLEKLIKGRPRR